jgi:hypothetical protein
VDEVNFDGGTLRLGTHRIDLSPFTIDARPVSNQEYARFLIASGRTIQSHRSWQGTPDSPVSFVTWDQATAYAQWRRKRLPTWSELFWAVRSADPRIEVAELYEWTSQLGFPGVSRADKPLFAHGDASVSDTSWLPHPEHLSPSMSGGRIGFRCAW